MFFLMETVCYLRDAGFCVLFLSNTESVIHYFVTVLCVVLLQGTIDSGIFFFLQNF